MLTPRGGRALDPAADFHDDGGTRAWRANQATYPRFLIVALPLIALFVIHSIFCWP